MGMSRATGRLLAKSADLFDGYAGPLELTRPNGPRESSSPRPALRRAQNPPWASSFCNIRAGDRARKPGSPRRGLLLYIRREIF